MAGLNLFGGEVEVVRFPRDVVDLLKRGVVALETIAAKIQAGGSGGSGGVDEIVDSVNALPGKLDAIAGDLSDIEKDVWVVANAIAPPHLVGGAITFSGLAPQGGINMFIVPDTQGNVRYTITPPTMIDARGRPVPAGTSLSYAVVADPTPDVSSGSPVGPGIVVTPDAADPLSGSIGPFNDNEDGSPATCNINVTVSANGGMIGSFGAQFTITAGPVTALQGGGIAFEGLTEEPPPAAARRR